MMAKSNEIINLTEGCHVVFEEPIFSGHWRNKMLEGYRTLGGEIVAEKYQKNGHCFTILLDEVNGTEEEKYKIGQKIRRFARNIYPLLEYVKYPEAQEDKVSRSEAAEELKEAWMRATRNRPDWILNRE